MVSRTVVKEKKNGYTPAERIFCIAGNVFFRFLFFYVRYLSRRG